MSAARPGSRSSAAPFATDAGSAADAPVSLVRAGERDAAVVGFEAAVVSFFVDAAEVLGVPKSVAAIYGICFASAVPLGFTEINERLDISSGSISQGLRILREVGALKVVTSPYEKRDRYVPDVEMRRLAAHFLEHRLERQIQSGQDRLAAIRAAVPAGNPAEPELRRRLRHLEGWHAKGRALVPLVRTFLKLT